MALINRLPVLSYVLKPFINPVRCITNYTSEEISPDIIALREKDLPVDMMNPYKKPKVLCILCKHKIIPDYKNVRLLSQFVSPYTGRIYGRHITALCKKKQYHVEMAILESRRAGMMAYYLKNPIFFKDPKLYDPENPLRPHKY